MIVQAALNFSRWSPLLLALQVFSGCTSAPVLPSPIGDVPNDLRVDRGLNPDSQDEFVRFRTSYYFRVIDSCRVQDGKEGDPGPYSTRLGVFQVRNSGKFKVVNDSLYRFKMTGKASALFSTVHFESGVLRAEQIDPFGSTVKYDKAAGGYRIESANVIRKRAGRDEVYKEIDKLLKLKNETLKNEGDDVTGKVKKLLIDQIELLGNGETAPKTEAKIPTTSPENEAGGDGESQLAMDKGNVLCPDGRPIQRSYFLYGPEGVRELDPDERLLMAMSSDSKPLTTMLQQLSNRQLAEGGNVSLLQTVGEEQGRMAGSFRSIAKTRAMVTSGIPDKERQEALQDLLKNILEKYDSDSGSSLLDEAKKKLNSDPGQNPVPTSNAQFPNGGMREGTES